MIKNEQGKLDEELFCPVGKFFSDLRKISGKQSVFFKHLTQSRIELLKAVQSLLDERIDVLQKEKENTGKKVATNIHVD